MKKDTWSDKHGCYECSFCEEPQGNMGGYVDGELVRYCKSHEPSTEVTLKIDA